MQHLNIKVYGLVQGVFFRTSAKEEANKLGLTGFMAGCMAQAVSHFHPRGEEFKQYWNGKFSNNKEKAEGVVNPAIIIVQPK